MLTFELVVSNKLPDQIWLKLSHDQGQIKISVHLQPQPDGSPPIGPGEGFAFKVRTQGIKPLSKGEDAAKLFDVVPKNLPLPIEITYLVNQKDQRVLIEVAYNIQKLN